ncbi:MAG: hypothetical protein JXA24_02675, partial [Proteobacteria bacterium]|nr:hypothetical protein [Pseudomonadota bacterium]
ADEQKRAEQAQKKADALAKAEAQKKAQEEKKAAAKAAAATAAPTPASAPATASAEWKQALKDFKKAKKKFEDGLPRIERRYADAVKADNYDDMRKAMDAYANHIGEYQTALSHLEIASDDPNKSKEIIEARALYKTHDNKWWEVNRQLVFSREPQSMEEIVKRPGAKGAEVIQLSQGFAGQKMKVEYQLHEDDTKALEFLNKQGGYKFVREESVPKGRKYRLIYVVRNEEFTSVYSRISRAGNDRQAAADAASRFMNLTVKV